MLPSRQLPWKELPTTKGRGTENWPSEIREDKRYQTAFIPSPCLKGWLHPCISRSTRRKVPRGEKEERAPFLRQLTQNPEPTNPQIQPHQDHMALQEYSEEGRAGRTSPHTDNPGKRPKTSHFPDSCFYPTIVKFKQTGAQGKALKSGPC